MRIRDNETLKKIMYITVSFVVAVMAMMLFLPTVELSAATVGNFTIDDGAVAPTDYEHTITGNVETLTIHTSNVGGVSFDTSPGNVGHVILDSGATVGNIITNGDVTVNGTVSFGIVTNGNLTVNGTVNNTQVDGNITVNSGGVVSGTANTIAGILNVAAGGSVGSVTIFGTTTIDGTNLTAQSAAGTSLVPLSAISSAGTITIEGDLTLSGTITQQIFSEEPRGVKRTITVLGDTTLSHASGGMRIQNVGGTDLNINSGTLTVSNGISLSSLWFNQNITINGNIAGDILINGPTYRDVNLNYESGTLTGKIDFDNTGNTVEIGTAATVTGNVEIGGNITVSGTINGNASATAGAINFTPTGVVTGLMSPLPSSNVVIDNLAGGTSANLAYNQYYPVNTANTLGAPQSAAPASGGYIRITTDGAKNILELNNIDRYIGSQYIEANGSTLPLEIYVVGATNNLIGISHNAPITMTAASGGALRSNINTSGTFTLQSGTLNAEYDVSGLLGRPNVVNGINAGAIVINGGELQVLGAMASFAGAATYEPALSVKPTINPPAGMMARIMAAPSRTGTPTEVAESTDYHLNNVVQISFVADPNANTNTGTTGTTTGTTTTTTTTTYNPAISPQTGVY